MFSMRRMTLFCILRRLLEIKSLRSRKTQSHTTRQTIYLVGNVTKVWILKIRSQNRVCEVQVYASKKLFLAKTFCSKALRQFSMRRMNMFSTLGMMSKIIFLRFKKN